EVTGAAVDLTGARVDAGEGLLVVQQQGLVRGVELHDLQGVEVRADRVHEAHGLVDLTGQLLVAVVPGTGGESPVPGVDLAQVGEAAAGEGAQQVQGRGAGGVRPPQACGIRDPRLRREVELVDRIAAVGGQG